MEEPHCDRSDNSMEMKKIGMKEVKAGRAERPKAGPAG
jgi:hypothetical protein